ncbi:MAG: putative lipid II flippase FtsW [Myxococcota bacterium]|jgi:cell division protein FtsW|nr:putative lipid II flippase FtsW [Myxococcota bacterium]
MDEKKHRVDAQPDTRSVVGLEPSEQAWDGWLLLIVCGLLSLGVVMIFSSSGVTATWEYGDPIFYLKRQLLFVLAGFALLYIGLRIDYRWYQRLVYPILFVTLALLAIVAVKGTTVGGATRWIRFGAFNFQPAEWTKIAMVMVLSYSVAKKGVKIKSFTVGMIPHVLLVGLVVGLLMMQPDFGTSVILFALMFAILFIGGTRISYILLALAIGSAGAWQLIVSSPYRAKRLMAFLDPWEHQSGIAYQVTESMIAIGSGGFTGRGLGEGTGKLGFVPELHTDFIGTAIAEEMGFFGVVLVVTLFLLLIWRGIHISLNARDRFGTYLAFGLTMLFGLQGAINLGVISGMLPTKGLTLPFISYGGSSLLLSMFAIGIMLNISRRADDTWELQREAREAAKREQRWGKKREQILARRVEERL